MPSDVPCWLVWKSASDGGRPYLVAVCTTEEISKRYIRMLKDEAELLNKPVSYMVEQSFLDHHLYGESMGQTFDLAKKLLMPRGG